MSNIVLDLALRGQAIKPMNAVNNGPVSGGIRQTPNNFETYKAANIPFARNHDASFRYEYGGEHTVDVHRIFRNFDADENDPANYIFAPTDECIRLTIEAGTQIYYRLGASIEHDFKFGTYPPKDFAKWARICEHIIRHYNEGWADGFHYNITYWEIWNEPDCINPDGSTPCWQGTGDQFVELYCTAAKHLKEQFPYIKVGGPAFCEPIGELQDKFLGAIRDRNIPFDFYSFHHYTKHLETMAETIMNADKILAEYGLSHAERILNEWNYVVFWIGEDWLKTIEIEHSLKAASFIAGAMCQCQALPLSMLMYYDAGAGSEMNGMFEYWTYKPLKGYYPFVMFDKLVKCGIQVPTDYVVDNIYSCAAADDEKAALMLTYYNDDDTLPAKDVCVAVKNAKPGSKVSCYLLDDANDLTLMRTEYCTAENFDLHLNTTLHASWLVTIE